MVEAVFIKEIDCHCYVLLVVVQCGLVSVCGEGA